MAWFVRFDRFLDIHAVYAQEQNNSCGIACVLMTVFKLNKLTPTRHPLHAEKEIYAVYSQVSHTKYNGSAYSYANHLASTLSKLRVGSWKAKYIGANKVAQAALTSVGVVKRGPTIDYPVGNAPMIVLVGWGSGGAHFVVIDSIVEFAGDKYAAVCDPWDGNVHITALTAGQPFGYVGDQVPWSWDFGGTRHEYDTPSYGGGNGWVVRRV